MDLEIRFDDDVRFLAIGFGLRAKAHSSSPLYSSRPVVLAPARKLAAKSPSPGITKSSRAIKALNLVSIFHFLFLAHRADHPSSQDPSAAPQVRLARRGSPATPHSRLGAFSGLSPSRVHEAYLPLANVSRKHRSRSAPLVPSALGSGRAGSQGIDAEGVGDLEGLDSES